MEHPPVPPPPPPSPLPPAQMDLQYLLQMQPMGQPGYSQYGYQDLAQLQMPCGDSCSAACAPACSEGRYITTFFVLVFSSPISLAFVVLFNKKFSLKFKIKSFTGQENVTEIQCLLE